jgi:hypothetical protein
MERLATLIGAGVGVGVAIDDLQCHLGVLELHLFILVLLQIHLLFALPLVGRCVVLVWQLLLLLAELLCKLLDLLALISVVPLGVMHRPSRATIVTTRRLMGVFVATWAMAPTSRCSCSSGCPDQWRIHATGLLHLLLVDTTLSSGIRIRLALPLEQVVNDRHDPLRPWHT